jgi:hypothetical protein
MKTYYKSIAGDVYMMLDSSNYQVVEVYYTTNLSSGNKVIKESYYNKKVTDSQDSTKWSVSDEESFLAIKNSVIASL